LIIYGFCITFGIGFVIGLYTLPLSSQILELVELRRCPSSKDAFNFLLDVDSCPTIGEGAILNEVFITMDFPPRQVGFDPTDGILLMPGIKAENVFSHAL